MIRPPKRRPPPTVLTRVRPSKQGPFRIHGDGTVYRDEGRGARYLGTLKPDDPYAKMLDQMMGAKGTR
jgi:hypothetical protein